MLQVPDLQGRHHNPEPPGGAEQMALRRLPWDRALLRALGHAGEHAAASRKTREMKVERGKAKQKGWEAVCERVWLTGEGALRRANTSEASGKGVLRRGAQKQCTQRGKEKSDQ